MAIRTDCKSEDDFIRDISQLLQDMIGAGDFMSDPNELDSIENTKKDFVEGVPDLDVIFGVAWSNDWGFQFEYWLPQIVEICCKYRGYKSVVTEERVLAVGAYSPDKGTMVASSTR